MSAHACDSSQLLCSSHCHEAARQAAGDEDDREAEEATVLIVTLLSCFL